MKGIILAGGKGTRLRPLTQYTSKQLLPIYDKPMVYYPLSLLMLAGINDILLITTPKDIGNYKELLGDGSQLGIKITYAIQNKSNGLAEAFIIGESFIGKDNVCLILGDNIFYGDGIISLMKESIKRVEESKKALIFSYQVKNPKDFGIINLNNNDIIDIEEKPINPKSNKAVVGLYMYPNDVIDIAKGVEPSARGELEITSVNNYYLSTKMLMHEALGRGYAWLDTGTIEEVLNASFFVKTIEERQGFKIACIEEIAYRNNWISLDQLKKLAHKLPNSEYGRYLINISEDII